ncbi:MAG: helix-turn-helix domain-containing protein [Phormidesmis sp.]
MESLETTQRLKELMQRAGIASYRALAAQAGVSRWQVQQLRSGKIAKMRLEMLAQLAIALQIPLDKLISEFGQLEEAEVSSIPAAIAPDPSQDLGLERSSTQQLAALQQEYQRLQAQGAQQIETARSQLQTDALQTLESWLVQWPTIAKRAQEREDLPAAKVLPFVKPVERLMVEWGVEAITPVDAQVPYDPQRHQLMGSSVSPGELVQVTHSGYQHQGKLLHRAKVKPVESVR